MTIEQMAREALHCLLQQKHYSMVEPEKRPRNFPLPIKRNQGAIQHYRPLAILEYCDAVLSGEVAAAEAKERAKTAKEAT